MATNFRSSLCFRAHAKLKCIVHATSPKEMYLFVYIYDFYVFSPLLLGGLHIFFLSFSQMYTGVCVCIFAFVNASEQAHRPKPKNKSRNRKRWLGNVRETNEEANRKKMYFCRVFPLILFHPFLFFAFIFVLVFFFLIFRFLSHSLSFI